MVCFSSGHSAAETLGIPSCVWQVKGQTNILHFEWVYSEFEQTLTGCPLFLQVVFGTTCIFSSCYLQRWSAALSVSWSLCSCHLCSTLSCFMTLILSLSVLNWYEPEPTRCIHLISDCWHLGRCPGVSAGRGSGTGPQIVHTVQVN